MEIKLTNAGFLIGKQHLIILMRTFIFLCCATVFSLAPNNIVSQNSKIKVEEDKILTVDEVFDLIMNQTDYKFFYEEGIFKGFPKVRVKKGVINTNKLLKRSLSQGDLSITVTANNAILIKEKSLDPFVNQPQLQISGIVTDKTGQPLPGTSIIEKGTTNGTTTDFDGKFSIILKNDSTSAILTVSYIGYATKEISVNGQTNFTILLDESAASLDEIVVVGYGTQKRSEVVSSISSISSEEISGKGFLNVGQAIQGQAPGVMVTQRSGQPGSSSTIRIRGIGTLNNNDPLVVIDGVQVTSGDGLDLINTEDIESIDILKDAASASIYGSRAGNGVILITTKKGTFKKPQVSYSSTIGYNMVSNKIDLLNAQEYMDISDEALVNGGNPAYWSTTSARADTDWLDEIFQQGFMQSHSVRVNGGNEFAKYYVSGGYDNQEGTLLYSGFKRYTYKSNIDLKISDKLSVGTKISYAHTRSNEIINPGSIDTEINSVLINAVRMAPTVPLFNPDGSYGFPETNEGDAQNPVSAAERSNIFTVNNRLFGNLYAEYKIIPELKFRTNFSVDLINREFSDFDPTFVQGNSKNLIASLSEVHSRNTGINWENTLTFTKSFNEVHNLNALAGHSIVTFDSKFTNASKKGFLSNEESLRYFSAATEEDNVGGSRTDWAIESYFGRINYNFKGKYFLQANARYDGSSRFGANNKWGFFPSAAIGWRISEESFLKEADWISNLKLRGSYGVSGTQPGNPYGFTSTLNQSTYVIGTNQDFVPGFAPSGSVNPDYQWETSYQTNIGLDVSVLDSRLSFTAEYYQIDTEDILQVLPLPSYAGIGGGLTNIGEMENSGFEFSVNYNNNIGKLNYSISGQIATLKNEVKKLFDDDSPITSGVSRTEVGKQIGSFYGFVTDGIFQNQAEIDSHAAQPDAVPGDIRFKDLNGDGSLSPDDLTFIGESLPSLTYSFNLGFTYDNFDLSMFFQGVSGNEIYNQGNFYILNGGNAFNKSTQILNRWQQPGDITNIPRVSTADPNDNFRGSDFFVENGAYLRMKNIQLGYTLSESVVKTIGVNKLRVYLSATNLFTITDYSGFDPEINLQNPLRGGIDNINYPQPRTMLFGLNLTF